MGKSINIVHGTGEYKIQSQGSTQARAQGKGSLTIVIPYRFVKHNGLKKGDILVAMWLKNSLRYEILKDSTADG